MPTETRVPLDITELMRSGEGWASTVATKGIEENLEEAGGGVTQLPTAGEVSGSRLEGAGHLTLVS